MCLWLSAAAGLAPLAASAVTVGQLRCEYLDDPLGIDVVQPRLSWIVSADQRDARDQRQSAYQVLVASSREALEANQGDLWDSHQVNSDQSIQVHYAGKALVSGEQCFWKVRVWDTQGKPSAWSRPALWTMGLLKPSDWHAKWIGLEESDAAEEGGSVLGSAQWIWFPEGQPEKAAPVGTRYFRRAFSLPADRAIKRAILLCTADNSGEFFINGLRVGRANDFHAAARFDVTGLLQRGENLLAASVQNDGPEPNPAGLIAMLRVEFDQGEPIIVMSDSAWKSGREGGNGWSTADFKDSGWAAAQKLGPAGMQPWGAITTPKDRRLAARMLRREFAVQKKVRRATAYICGLGLSEFYLNGKKVGDAVLSPALSDYSKRDFYVTYDVTKQVKKGANVAGVILGNGRFFAPRATVPTGTTSYGFPKLLFQLHIEYADGTAAEVVSDENWKLTTDGPIRANNEYDGEDLRRAAGNAGLERSRVR